jgi:hypothetical protein
VLQNLEKFCRGIPILRAAQNLSARGDYDQMVAGKVCENILGAIGPSDHYPIRLVRIAQTEAQSQIIL